MPKGEAFLELRDSCASWLAEHPGAVQVHLAETTGCQSASISAWEEREGALLPDDLRDFYLQTDGMVLRWDVVAHGRQVMPLGCMAINSLHHLVPVSQSVLRNERDELRTELPSHAASWHAFNLDASCETGRVLLLLGSDAPSSARRHAQVWFQDGSCALSLLASSFSEYVRLLMLHLGLPRWQYAYTEAGLDPTCRQWLRLMAPDRLVDPKSSSAVVATDGWSTEGNGGGRGGGSSHSSSSSSLGSGTERDGAASILLGSAGALGVSWGGTMGAGLAPDDTHPVRTRWVGQSAPSHEEALSLLSLSSLQQQQHTGGAHSTANSRPSSAAGAPRQAVALLSGGNSASSSSRPGSAAVRTAVRTAASEAIRRTRVGSAAPRKARAPGARAVGHDRQAAEE